MSETSPPRILVADDEISIRRFVECTLRPEGYLVETAVGGRRALEMLHTHSYDLLLLDRMMPDLDGYQVLAELRGDSAYQSLPVILLAAKHA